MVWKHSGCNFLTIVYLLSTRLKGCFARFVNDPHAPQPKFFLFFQFKVYLLSGYIPDYVLCCHFYVVCFCCRIATCNVNHFKCNLIFSSLQVLMFWILLG